MRLRKIPTFLFPSLTASYWKSILEAEERSSVAENNGKPIDLAISDVSSSAKAVYCNQAVTLTPLAYGESFCRINEQLSKEINVPNPRWSLSVRHFQECRVFCMTKSVGMR